MAVIQFRCRIFGNVHKSQTWPTKLQILAGEMFNTPSALSTTPERRSLPEPRLSASRRSPPEVRFSVALDDVVVTAGFVCCAVESEGAGDTVGVLGARGAAGSVPTSTIKIPIFTV